MINVVFKFSLKLINKEKIHYSQRCPFISEVRFALASIYHLASNKSGKFSYPFLWFKSANYFERKP